MTADTGKLKIDIIIVLILFMNFACSNPQFIKIDAVQKEIDQAISEIELKRPGVKYISIYFSKSERGKKYVFISEQVSLITFETKYYYRRGNVNIFIVFGTKELEKEYSNPNAVKATKVFEIISHHDIYENIEIVYEIYNVDSLIRIQNPEYGVLKLHDFNRVKFIPPLSR